MSTRWTLPAHLYKSKTVFDVEMKTIFRQNWLLFGSRPGKLEKPGNQWAQTIVPAVPMIALQTRTGKTNLFWNVCKHRAGPLQYDGTHFSGTGNDILMCKYHKWCYDSEGRLTATPNYGDKELDMSQFKLDKIETADADMFIFFRLNSGGPPLQDSYGDLWERLKRFDLPSYQLLGHRQHLLNCNWKTYAENYLEGYHIPAVHPSLNATLDIKQYKVIPHTNYIEHVQGGQSSSQYSGLWIFLWPNLALNFYKSGLSVEQIIPHNQRLTEIRYTFLGTPSCSPSEQDDLMKWSKVVTEEDVQVCEAVQAGLESGSYTRGLLAPVHELGVQYFQQRYRESVPSALLTQAEAELD